MTIRILYPIVELWANTTIAKGCSGVVWAKAHTTF